jgi:hypothetical protein
MRALRRWISSTVMLAGAWVSGASVDAQSQCYIYCQGVCATDCFHQGGACGGALAAGNYPNCECAWVCT